MKQTFILNNPMSKERCFKAVATAGDHWVVTISEPKRSLQQNALMWALLSDLADQVDWHGLQLTAENWKDMCTAAIKKQQVVPGLDGGFVVLGTSTSKMSKLEMNELIEFIYAFGAQHGVKFTDAYDQ
jgi:hypothetical protein